MKVAGLSNVVEIAAGWDHSVARRGDGSVVAWGSNDTGQVGDGTLAASRPQRVSVVEPSGSTTQWVVERYNTLLDHYFITADANEGGSIDNGAGGPGWVVTGERFKAGGPTAVCRFYGSQSPGPNSHFYTLAGAECDQLRQLQATTPATQKRWNFESLDFASSAVVGTDACPARTIPVFRAYNGGFARGIDSNHRITTNITAITEAVARGWSSEGAVMCAPSE